MGENSKIEWTDHTFNPWMGCTKVSPACTNCYAERDMDKRLGKVQWGPGGTRVVTSESNWNQPIKWNREAEESFASWKFAVKTCVSEYDWVDPYVRPRVFCASLADVFEDWKFCIYDNRGGTLWRKPDGRFFSTADEQDVDGDQFVTMDDLRRNLFKLIDATPNIDWLLLTKRPENIRRMWVDDKVPWRATGQWHRDNVWLGTSVENQEQADKRIPELLKCRDLSPVLFLSCEPLLGHVNLTYPPLLFPNGPSTCCSGFECGCRGLPCDPPAYLNATFGGVDWVIAGGESGPSARPSHPDWFRSLRDQCQDANVPFHFKQWGEWSPVRNATSTDMFDASKTVIVKHDGRTTTGLLEHDGGDYVMDRVGKKNAGRLLDGRTWDEMPVSTSNTQ